MEQLAGSAVVRIAPPFSQVVVSGELDLCATPVLAVRLREAAAAGCRTLRVDLGEVTFCDVSTIRVLVQADRYLRLRGGALQVTAASDCVRRLLHLLRLGALLDDAGTATSRPA